MTATNTENGISINANYSVAAGDRTATVTLTYGESVATFKVAQEEGKLYLKPNSNWLIDNARFAVYTWSPENWCDMPAVTVNGQTYYEVAVARVAANLIFCRMSSSATANNWNNKWNQTKDLTFPTNGNLYTIEENSWDNGNGTWSVLQAE